MRLWTLHPKYLDSRGLVALWREALLAQAVLRGATRGYRHHPQLQRFQASADPVAAIVAYLQTVQQEASRRGYRFDVTRICSTIAPWSGTLPASDGQLAYEWQHLCAKLRQRDPAWLARLIEAGAGAGAADNGAGNEPDSSTSGGWLPAAHPLFTPSPGPIAGWEIITEAPR